MQSFHFTVKISRPTVGSAPPIPPTTYAVVVPASALGHSNEDPERAQEDAMELAWRVAAEVEDGAKGPIGINTLGRAGCENAHFDETFVRAMPVVEHVFGVKVVRLEENRG